METQSATVTETETETITTEVPQPTVTVLPPAGFTPIRSVYPAAAPAPAGKRDLEARGKGHGEPVRPGDFRCTSTSYTTVTRRTVTRYITSTTTARRETITKKRTKTIKTTTSVLPVPASRTETFSMTVTVADTIINTYTQTATVTGTTSTTASGPTPTTYGACAADNILDTYRGQYLDTIYFAPPGGSVNLGSQASPYACCVACLNEPTCAGAAYLGGLCIGTTPDVSCSGNLASGLFEAGSSENSGWTVSNSGCGQFASV